MHYVHLRISLLPERGSLIQRLPKVWIYLSVTVTVMERPISRISSTPLKSRPRMTQPSTSLELSSRSVKMTKSLPGSHQTRSPLR